MLSLVLPIYNEAPQLRAVVGELRAGLDVLGVPYEIILVENGSGDETRNVAQALVEAYPQVRVLVLPHKNYGAALRLGILEAKGDTISHASVDFFSLDFLNRSLKEMEKYSIVIGSKALGSDARPAVRRWGSQWFHALVRTVFRVGFTDTHGIKSFRRDDVVPLAIACISDGDMFDTELLIRAHRSGLSMIEVPVSVREKKGYYAVSPVRLIRRFLAASWWILKLRMNLR